jgi:translation elongation factor EF-Tu-like GTPase
MIILRNKEFSFLDYFKKDIGPKTSNTGPFRMFIEAEYNDSKRHKIKEHTYIQGTIDSGIINVGDEIDIVGPNVKIKATVEEIWTFFRKKVTQAKRGDKVDLQLNILNKNIDRGMIAYTSDSIDFALAERMSKKYTREHFPKNSFESLFVPNKRKKK